MRCSNIRGIALAAVLLAAAANVTRADFEVEKGWDLWETDAGSTQFNGFAFEGVPLGTFDFGGSIGVQNVENADTIVQRFEPAVVG